MPTLIPSPSPTVARGQDGVLRLLGEDEDIETWDPHRTESPTTHRPLSFIYSKLFRLPESDGPVPYDRPPLPDLVERWEMTSPTTYVFQLRQGVRFHDKPPVSGRELVAEDVRYSLGRFRDSSLPSRAWWRAVDSIEAPDPYTVRINLSEPFAPLLFYLGGHFSWVLAREVDDEARSTPGGAIGTGAWLLKDYVPGARAVFQRNPAYSLSRVPSVEEIQWQTVRDTLTRRAALMSGLLDVMPVDKGLLAELKQGAPDLQVYEYMPLWGPGAQALAMRSDIPPFADVKVRRAVSLSFHRPAWRDTFLPGGGVDNAAPVPAVLGWGLTLEQLGAEGRYSRFDVAQARQFMAEAGYPKGLATYLNFPQDRGYERKAEIMGDFLLA
ncbi:MAG: ABC transporter substrate-binding protein, partial [Chloroflexota bacterium]|nr:ABC transporter substrate-binding protein [Chloroflexota bacterium]